MKRLATVGLASLATLAIGSAASAGAPEKNDPRCLSYGEGFIYSDSTGFCVRISGSIEAGFVAGSHGERSGSEGRMTFDARKDTDFGPVRVYVQPKGSAFQ